MNVRPPPWWRRAGLDVVDGRLRIVGRDAEQLARDCGTPHYVFDLDRIVENAKTIGSALRRAGLRTRMRYALKANREPEVLGALRALQGDDVIGIDACSPGEVLHARAHGWRPEEISFTGTNLSERDLDVVLAEPIHLNLDAISQIDRVGRRARGRRIGIRINPSCGVGYGPKTTYSGARPTKFGILSNRLADAVEAARRHDLVLDTVHFHVGSGWLADGLARFEEAVETAAIMVKKLVASGCPIEEINVGGGIGVRARAHEQSVDLDAYARILGRHLGPLDTTIACEPGDYITKDAAILLGEVVVVEDRGRTTFVGVDFGWNVNCAFFIYKYAQEIVVCRAADAPTTTRVTIAGHINEASDVFAEDYEFPAVAEGDFIAILNAGGYIQAMAMNHCLRPTAQALYLRRKPG